MWFLVTGFNPDEVVTNAIKSQRWNTASHLLAADKFFMDGEDEFVQCMVTCIDTNQKGDQKTYVYEKVPVFSLRLVR